MAEFGRFPSKGPTYWACFTGTPPLAERPASAAGLDPRPDQSYIKTTDLVAFVYESRL